MVIGSGQRLRYEGEVYNVALNIQDYDVMADLYVLPMHRSDVVLGITWLLTLGPILADYTTRVMEFTFQGTPVRLVGEPPMESQPVQL